MRVIRKNRLFISVCLLLTAAQAPVAAGPADGTIYAYSSGNVVTMRASDGRVTGTFPCGGHPSHSAQPSFLRRTGADSIYVLTASQAAGSDCTNGDLLYQDPAMSLGMPKWSPDDSKVVFSGARGTERGLWTASVVSDGSGGVMLTELRLVQPIPYTHAIATWSPDGRYLLFSMDIGTPQLPQYDIFKVDTVAGGATNLTNTAAASSILSCLPTEPAWHSFAKRARAACTGTTSSSVTRPAQLSS